jgi:hypothetical protein
MNRKEPRWPMAIFLATAACVLFSACVTLLYYEHAARIQSQEREIVAKQAEYKAEVDQLRSRLLVTTTKVREIETPVTGSRSVCTSVPTFSGFKFGTSQFCTQVPTQSFEKRQVPEAVQVEDPETRRNLDLKLKELEGLSAAALESHEKQVDLKSVVDASKQLLSPLISLIVTIASLVVILSKRYRAESEKWAFGTLGTVLGFWLK